MIDSGADHCVFPAQDGRALKIPIEAGKRYSYSGATGGGLAYFHSLKVLANIEGRISHFNCFCGFTDGLNEIGIGLLGRHGFFELFRPVSFRQDEKVVVLELK